MSQRIEWHKNKYSTPSIHSLSFASLRRGHRGNIFQLSGNKNWSSKQCSLVLGIQKYVISPPNEFWVCYWVTFQWDVPESPSKGIASRSQYLNHFHWLFLKRWSSSSALSNLPMMELRAGLPVKEAHFSSLHQESIRKLSILIQYLRL